MTLPLDILNYLEKRIQLYATVKPSTTDSYAWIHINYNLSLNSNNIILNTVGVNRFLWTPNPEIVRFRWSNEPEKYIFRWLEISQIMYNYLQKEEGEKTKRKFNLSKNFFQKYVTDENELETLIKTYLDEISLLSPNLVNYPFD